VVRKSKKEEQLLDELNEAVEEVVQHVEESDYARDDPQHMIGYYRGLIAAFKRKIGTLKAATDDDEDEDADPDDLFGGEDD